MRPEHPIVKDLAAENPELRAKVDQLIAEQRKARETGDIGEIEKHGVFTGRYAINPFNSERVPVWVANYILMDYGTGAIMSVPAHDERDYEFAKKYGLEIRIVILPLPSDPEDTVAEPALPFVGHDGHADQLRAVQHSLVRRRHPRRCQRTPKKINLAKLRLLIA